MLKGIINVFVGLERVWVWQAVVLRFDWNGAKEEKILFMLATLHIFAVIFSVQNSPVIQIDVWYNGDADSENWIWENLK